MLRKKALGLALLLLAADAAAAPARDPAKLTLKERSGGKAGDPQRVNDCKVPVELRDDPRRPAACPSPRRAPAALK